MRKPTGRSGTFSNFGSINNLGSITSTGVILNSGYINNTSSASITNSRTITNNGNIANSGTLANACGGVIFGPGTITGDPVTTITVCTATISPVPEFPTEMLAAVMLTLMIVVSLAARRGRGRSS